MTHVDGRQMVTASRKTWWNWRKIFNRAYVEDQVHADEDVEQEVTMEQPET